MIHRGQTSHVASNFSVIDIATVLYSRLKPGDEVVWSKGWAAATVYYFLAQQGKIPQEDLDEFPNAPYLGLAETTVPGVWCNGGSVGHGLPIAVGMAWAKRNKKEKGTIFCIMSDGELNEGTTWESCLFASHHKLDNLVVIVDKNKWQAMGKTKDIIDISHPEDLFKAFGFASHIADGHEHSEIDFLLKYIEEQDTCYPKALVCSTVKGKGVKEMENHLTYHYKHVDAELYQRSRKELTRHAKTLS